MLFYIEFLSVCNVWDVPDTKGEHNIISLWEFAIRIRNVLYVNGFILKRILCRKSTEIPILNQKVHILTGEITGVKSLNLEIKEK